MMNYSIEYFAAVAFEVFIAIAPTVAKMDCSAHTYVNIVEQ